MDWETLKRLGGSTLAKYVIVVPLVGWILILHGEFSTYLERDWGVLQTDGLEWRIHCFFIGLCLIAVSSFLFLWRCPAQISDFAGESEFVEKEMRLITIFSANRIAGQSSLQPPGFVKGNDLDEAEGLADRTIWLRNNEQILLDLLRSVYLERNQSDHLVRLISVTAFFIGSTLALVPTAAAIWKSLLVVFT